MDDLIAAVTQLRSTLGDSQQAFANRLGLSFRAIANYEKGRRPTGRVLYQLANLAHESGRKDLAQVFAGVFSQEVKADVQPTNAEERLWIQALLSILRRRDDLTDSRSLEDALIANLKVLVQRSKDRERRDLEALLVQIRLHVEGSALRLLDALSEERSRHTGETRERAYFEILQQYPDLYAKYNQERAEGAKGTHAEGTMSSPRASAPQAQKSKMARKNRK